MDGGELKIGNSLARACPRGHPRIGISMKPPGLIFKAVLVSCP